MQHHSLTLNAQRSQHQTFFCFCFAQILEVKFKETGIVQGPPDTLITLLNSIGPYKLYLYPPTASFFLNCILFSHIPLHRQKRLFSQLFLGIFQQ